MTVRIKDDYLYKVTPSAAYPGLWVLTSKVTGYLLRDDKTVLYWESPKAAKKVASRLKLNAPIVRP